MCEFALGNRLTQNHHNVRPGSGIRPRMGLTDNPGPVLYVPDMTQAPTARVSADGTVECIACKTRLPLASADVVGQGYRCAKCSAKAEVARLAGGKSDVADHLSDANRADLRKLGTLYLALGAVLSFLGVALFIMMGLEQHTFGRHPGTYVTAFGVGLLVVGSMRRGAAS